MRGRPIRWLRVLRNGRIAFLGYVGETVRDGDDVHVTAYTPEKLVLDSREPPFPPPMPERAVAPTVFDFWWKQLDYVFGLSDPRDFPPLPNSLSAQEANITERYVRVAGDLAASRLINALEEQFLVHMPDGPQGREEIEQRFCGRDLQAGFAALLRQCDSTHEPAHFERVRSILWLASEAASDAWKEKRLRALAAWSMAVKALHRKSLNQLLRDKLVTEGVGAVRYDEEHSPDQLLSIYSYGDLIHWGDRRDVVAKWEEDDYIESDRRLAYLNAAGALAHVYIGFGELARTATGYRAADLGAV